MDARDRPMTGRELTLDLPGQRMRALEWGPADGAPILAVHGWLDNAASFVGLAPMLDRYRVIALDLAGHGRSDHWPQHCSHYFVDWVPQVIGAADALGCETFVLLGHSMGAGISSLVPSAAPGRVSRLVLLEGAGPLTTPPDDAPALLRTALEDERRVAAASPRIHPDFESALAARCQGTDLSPDAGRPLVERSVETVAGGVRFTFDPRLKTRSRWRFTEEQVLAFLAVIDCPVLMVRADAGWPVPEDQMEARLATIPKLTRVEVEGGHHVHLTNPERVAPAILEFLTVD